MGSGRRAWSGLLAAGRGRVPRGLQRWLRRTGLPPDRHRRGRDRPGGRASRGGSGRGAGSCSRSKAAGAPGPLPCMEKGCLRDDGGTFCLCLFFVVYSWRLLNCFVSYQNLTRNATIFTSRSLLLCPTCYNIMIPCTIHLSSVNSRPVLVRVRRAIREGGIGR